MITYLDNAATSAKKPFCVYLKMMKETYFGSYNAGRGGYAKSIDAVKKIQNTSESIAELFNIENPSQIAYTPNATYALNMLISGTVSPKDHIIITQMEHNSVFRPVHALGNYTIVKAEKNGNINPWDIENAVNDNTRLIICTHASNVCGTILPIEKIGKIAARHKIPFLVDASQTGGILNIDVQKMNIDMLALSGHKGLMGPLGTGILYVNENIPIKPLITGGTGSLSESPTQPDIMPDMLQSGTYNAPAIFALGTAVRFVQKRYPEIYQKEHFLAESFIREALNIKGFELYGNISENRNGTVSFNIKNKDCAKVSEILDRDFNICVRSGFHCAPLAHKALGTEKIGTVRASFGYFNSKGDIYRLLTALNKISKMA